MDLGSEAEAEAEKHREKREENAQQRRDQTRLFEVDSGWANWEGTMRAIDATTAAVTAMLMRILQPCRGSWVKEERSEAQGNDGEKREEREDGDSRCDVTKQQVEKFNGACVPSFLVEEHVGEASARNGTAGGQRVASGQPGSAVTVGSVGRRRPVLVHGGRWWRSLSLSRQRRLPRAIRCQPARHVPGTSLLPVTRLALVMPVAANLEPEPPTACLHRIVDVSNR